MRSSVSSGNLAIFARSFALEPREATLRSRPEQLLSAFLAHTRVEREEKKEKQKKLSYSVTIFTFAFAFFYSPGK